MEITNKHNLPNVLMKVVQQHQYSKGKADYSVSDIGIGEPAKKVILTRKNSDKISKDIVDQFYAIYGTVLHYIFEQADDEATLKETRLYKEVKIKDHTRILGGMIDCMRKVSEFEGEAVYGILDYKTTSAFKYTSAMSWKSFIRDHTIKQNIYRLLAQENGYNVQELKLLVLFRDWVAGYYKTKKGYPAPIMEVTLKVLPDALVNRWIKTKIKDLILAETVLADCTPRQTWLDHQGIPKRCIHYCPASEFCFQYQTYKKEILDKLETKPKTKRKTKNATAK